MELEGVFYRIIAGYYYIYVGNKTYKIYSPTLSLKQKAHSLYLSIIENNKYDINSWVSHGVIDNLLKVYSIWNEDKEKNFQHLLKSLDNAKIELFLNFANTRTRESIKKLISSLTKQINDEYNKKHYFDYLTLDYYSNSLRNQFLIMNTVFHDDGTRAFGNNIDDIDTLFLENILYEIYTSSIALDDIKTLANHEIWRSYWDASSNGIFGGSPIDWTDEQRTLINITKMIDSIREHHERPSDEVFNDFDALDGWILHQKQQNEKEKKKQQISDMVSNDKRDRMDEVFVVTNSQEETKEIFSLNDPTTRHNIRSMSKIANEKGKVKWAELPHIKRELENQFNEMKRNKIKGS